MVERMRRAIEVTRKRLLTIINTWWQLVLKDSDNILICVLHGAFLIHVLLNESCTRFNEKMTLLAGFISDAGTLAAVAEFGSRSKRQTFLRRAAHQRPAN